MAPRKKGVEREWSASTLYDSAMSDILNGAPLTIAPAKTPDSAITPHTIMTKDGPVVVYNTDLTDDDGTSAALWNLFALAGFDPENQE